MVKIYWWLSNGYVYKQEGIEEFKEEIWGDMTETERDDVMSDIIFNYLDWGYSEVDTEGIIELNVGIGLAGCYCEEKIPVYEYFPDWDIMTEDEKEKEMQDIAFDTLDYGWIIKEED